jgi:hypothetical protein
VKINTPNTNFVNTLIFFLLIQITLVSCKKDAQTSLNTNSFGTIFGYGSEHFLSNIIKTSDQHYLICGTTIEGTNGMYDGFVMKVDENFNTIWYKNFGGAQEDYFNSMVLDNDGNIMLAGHSNSFGVSADSALIQTNTLFYLVYCDKNGNKIWDKTLQANPDSLNFRNRATKVVYLKDNTFCITGNTENFTFNPAGTSFNYTVNYAFGIDKQSKIIWEKVLYKTPVSVSQPGVGDENDNYCQNATVTADGNIILLNQGRDINKKPYWDLIKFIPGDTAFSTNRYIWRSKPIFDFVSPQVITYSNNPNISFNVVPMLTASGSKTLIADLINGGLIMTNENGEFEKKIGFQKTMSNIWMSKDGDKIMVVGKYLSNGTRKPCWAILNNEGIILEQIYSDWDQGTGNQISLFRMFEGKAGELIGIGKLQSPLGSSIILLKFDHLGNLIK